MKKRIFLPIALFFIALFALCVNANADDWTYGSTTNTTQYTLTAPTSGYIHIKMQIIPNEENTSQMTFRMLDSMNALVYTKNSYKAYTIRKSKTEYSTKDGYWPVEAGTYTLQCEAKGYIQYRYSYDFISIPTPYDKEPNSTNYEARSIPSDTVIAGTICQDNDRTDIYKFTIYRKQAITAYVRSYGHRVSMNILNASSNIKGHRAVSGGSAKQPVTEKLTTTLSAGTYYIKISGSVSRAPHFYDFQINYDSSQPIKVSSIKLSNVPSKMAAGSSKTLSISISPQTAEDKGITWKSSKPSVISVNSKGKITAKAPGTAKITVTADDGSGKSASKTINVVPKKVSKLTLSKNIAKWTSVSNITAYQIQYSTDKNFAGKKTLKTKRTSISLNLKKGKTYYVRVRAYKKVGTKYYCGSWSTTSTIKY